ncbi:hypothetical protein ACH50O_01500 [Methylomonas sp. 2BW1-5-20]|uniref:hypothetical protein n=1 Tax=Methylomonas sp. 2BW1-5-20 TaxID=3376686 RepID=UPI004051FDE0
MTTSPINFEHRIPWDSDDRLQSFHIEDAICSPLERARAVAELLETAANWDAENLNPAVVRAAAEIIQAELDDANLLAKICLERSTRYGNPETGHE